MSLPEPLAPPGQASAPVRATPRILLIRRDNIGDLVCITPLITALRERFPGAYLAAYVNSYNRAVLDGNPALDAVFAYTKAKHLEAGVWRNYWARVRQFLALRRLGLDDVLIAEPGYSPRLVQLARLFAAKRIIGFARAEGTHPGMAIGVPRGSQEVQACLHEVEDVFRLGSAYGIEGPPPPVRVYPRPGASTADAKTVVGVHVSARKPSQRWPAAAFAEVITRLAASGAEPRLFWSPGREDDAKHPGDDEKAAAILALASGVPVRPCPTPSLESLIDGLASCHAVICADGGAMHLAAGLGKPIVCLFGKSNAKHWRPWGVPHQLLQTPSEEVSDLRVDDVWAAWQRLASETACVSSPPQHLPPG